ncbi:MAG: hypothetical protein QM779_14230 [Propionicimonas sp.]|uniref:hypothetical protein n=1 Tax=Propionicimonas sp. TaxID=1955623 RepID=UPI003D14689E
MRRAAVAVALVVLLSGCASGGTAMSTPTPSASGTPASASPSPTGTNAVPAARWTAILADLEKRGVPTDDVQVVSARTVTWNSGALGCPQPGKMYTQALVDGLQVVVSAGGKQYDYRFGHSDNPKLCEGIK